MWYCVMKKNLTFQNLIIKKENILNLKLKLKGNISNHFASLIKTDNKTMSCDHKVII